MTALEKYDLARSSLAEAKSFDDVKGIRDKAEALRLYARQAKDREMEIWLGEIRSRAERRIGELKLEAREAGELHEGGRPKKTPADREEVSKIKLADLGIDEKLSMRAEKLARIGAADYELLVGRCRDQLENNPKFHAFDVLRERDGHIGGARSIMAGRQEPDDSLDFFPTPPWATRALLHHVIPQLGAGISNAWEPACGEGHISEVLRGYGIHVHATDVFDYGTAWQDGLCDFLSGDYAPSIKPGRFDWILTNPPFGDKSIGFVDRALEFAGIGVAMFFRSQWAVEGIERYESIFRDRPPSLCAFFAERVNLCKGHWDPDGSTATAYCWLVWLKDGSAPRAPFWIPPGCREALTHQDDRARFAAWSIDEPAAQSGASEAPQTLTEPELSELQALETIEVGREIDIKLKLTKLGMKRLEALRLEEYSKSDEAPPPDRAAVDQVQEENIPTERPKRASRKKTKQIDIEDLITGVDCRVCNDGNGLCAECIAADDHAIAMTNPDGTATATCSCGWRHEYPWGDHAAIQDAAIKGHWQNVVTEAKAAAASICESEPPSDPPVGTELDIPAFLKRGPDGVAAYQRGGK